MQQQLVAPPTSALAPPRRPTVPPAGFQSLRGIGEGSPNARGPPDFNQRANGSAAPATYTQPTSYDNSPFKGKQPLCLSFSPQLERVPQSNKEWRRCTVHVVRSTDFGTFSFRDLLSCVSSGMVAAHTQSQTVYSNSPAKGK